MDELDNESLTLKMAYLHHAFGPKHNYLTIYDAREIAIEVTGLSDDLSNKELFQAVRLNVGTHYKFIHKSLDRCLEKSNIQHTSIRNDLDKEGIKPFKYEKDTLDVRLKRVVMALQGVETSIYCGFKIDELAEAVEQYQEDIKNSKDQALGGEGTEEDRTNNEGTDEEGSEEDGTEEEGTEEEGTDEE